MRTSGSSVSSEAATTSSSDTSLFEYTPQVVDYRSLLAQPGTRLLADINDRDDPLWILAFPEDANDWNRWEVAYNRAARNEDDEWIVHRTVWWWGVYTDRADDYTEWFIQPMIERAALELEPPRVVWN